MFTTFVCVCAMLSRSGVCEQLLREGDDHSCKETIKTKPSLRTSVKEDKLRGQYYYY